MVDGRDDEWEVHNDGVDDLHEEVTEDSDDEVEGDGELAVGGMWGVPDEEAWRRGVEAAELYAWNAGARAHAANVEYLRGINDMFVAIDLATPDSGYVSGGEIEGEMEMMMMMMMMWRSARLLLAFMNGGGMAMRRMRREICRRMRSA